MKVLRKLLHQNAEPSMREKRTKKILMNDIGRHTHSFEIVDRGAWFYCLKKGSLVRSEVAISTEESEIAEIAESPKSSEIAETAEFPKSSETAETAGTPKSSESAESPKSSETGKAPIAFRADFDAVMCGDGVARHLCGHDGHSAVLAGLARVLDQKEVDRDVYLIFQPGEEVGEGARCCASLISEKGIGEIYGFHNIPGYGMNQVILPKQTFACASTGLEIRLTGQESHAAYPEEGKNPALAIAEMICFMEEFVAREHEGIVLGTVIGVDVGSSSYGVSAGEGVLRLTLRGEIQEEFEELLSVIEEKAMELSTRFGLKCSMDRIEEFPATVNAPGAIAKVDAVAAELGLERITPEEPFRWSEDFGYYLQKTKGAMFGVGCGENHPGLHTPEYEFEDEIMDTVVKIFVNLI